MSFAQFRAMRQLEPNEGVVYDDMIDFELPSIKSEKRLRQEGFL